MKETKQERETRIRSEVAPDPAVREAKDRVAMRRFNVLWEDVPWDEISKREELYLVCDSLEEIAVSGVWKMSKAQVTGMVELTQKIRASNLDSIENATAWLNAAMKKK